MIENREHPFQNVPNYLVSIHLFKNKLIQNHIEENGFNGVCHYTNNFTKVLSLKNIVIFINDILSKYFENPDNETVRWDPECDDDSNESTFHKELGGYMVPGNRRIYTDMEKLLKDNLFAVDVNYKTLFTDIVNAFGDIRLIQQDPYGLTEDEERFLDWKYIVENTIKMSAKGMDFSNIIEAEKVRLYGLLSAIQAARSPLLKKTHLTLFRCVNYDSTKTPPVQFSDLTSPPIQYTKDLRMSKRGDSIFYGALEKETAKKEALKSSSDNRVYIGTFETMHDLHILDLTGIADNLSIFNQNQDSYYILLFLSQFCHAISLPVYNPPTEYIPTQLITFYFRNYLKFYHKDESKSDLDGILYRSSKDNSVNAALFYDNESSAKHLRLLEYEVIDEGSSKRYTYP